MINKKHHIDDLHYSEHGHKPMSMILIERWVKFAGQHFHIFVCTNNGKKFKYVDSIKLPRFMPIWLAILWNRIK